MCKTVHTLVQHLVSLETMQDTPVLVSHRFNCFIKIVFFNMIIKLKLKSINYNSITPIKSKLDTKNLNWKNMAIPVIKLIEP